MTPLLHLRRVPGAEFFSGYRDSFERVWSTAAPLDATRSVALMSRRDYYDDPAAPKANSIVPAVTAGVVADDGRVLLIHRVDNDRWALPGGTVEIGEGVAQTVVREVREETGIGPS